MVWLRDPPGQQPAGAAATAGATVTGLPGTWKIWTGSVNGHPIVNYTQDEGHDLSELEYDVIGTGSSRRLVATCHPGACSGRMLTNAPCTPNASTD